MGDGGTTEENQVSEAQSNGQTRAGVKPPKGRPTPGRKQRNAAARAAARRHRRNVRLMWAGSALVLIGIVVVLIVTGVGAGSGVG